MRTADLIITAFEKKIPVHLGAIPWSEFLEALKQLENRRKG